MSDDSTPLPHDTERDRGILTEADRQYLEGEKELKPQSEREARQRIRNRLENGLLDLALLRFRLRDDDREPVAESIFPDDGQVDQYLTDIFGLLFRMILSTSKDIDQSVNRFEKGIETAFRKVIRTVREDALVDINVDMSINIREPDEEKLKTKFNNDEETLEELLYMAENGMIERDDVYHDHLFRNMWHESEKLVLQLGDSMDTVDPSDYDSAKSFRDACEKLLNQARSHYEDEDEDS
jgi:hypothetical protein